MLSQIMKRIAYSKDAQRTLRRIPANAVANIRENIKLYATTPVALANKVVRLQGMSGYFRLRVGDWRVIFTENAEIIAIIKIGARGSVYE
jgi:mRNA interferase RelE/StbE